MAIPGGMDKIPVSRGGPRRLVDVAARSGGDPARGMRSEHKD